MKFSVVAFFLMIFTFAQAQISHAEWDLLLQEHVTSSGKVNYDGFKKDVSNLDKYLDKLSSNYPASDWSSKQKLAYWINAYNAYTVKLIVDNYPINSIRDLDNGNPWDVQWIKLGGKTFSLNNIEHNIIRPQFNEPRIHFAVNCAANSCPPLLNHAWTAKNLESNLEQQTRSFINNSRYNQISEKGTKMSKIFEWYAEDFGNLATFINKYANRKVKAGQIGYAKYDWNLNKQ